VTHIETITKVVTGLYLLNTAYNIIKVTSGLVNVATTILGNTFTITAGKIGLATGAVKLFRTALITTGVGALVVALGFIIEAIINTNDAAEDGTPTVTNYGGALRKSGADADWAAGRFGIATTAATNLANAMKKIPASNSGVMDAYAYNLRTNQPVPVIEDDNDDDKKKGGPGAAKAPSLLQTLQREATIVKKQAKLVAAGVSEGLAARLTATAKPVARANKALKAIAANNGKLTKNLKKLEKNLAAATQPVVNAVDESVEVIQDSSVAEAIDDSVQKEKDALRERERNYNSFLDSVKSTFAQIKDRILDAFTLPQLGGSTESIIRNMDKLLTRLKAFSGNITKLSSMGLDPKLLQQVINAGPIAGAKLAANLVAGGVGGLSAINAGYSQLAGVSGEIGMTGTQSLFGTQQQQTIYNLTVEGGLDSPASIGKAVVDAIKAYERTSGAVFQGA
jgi:hypothetical protein